MSYASTAQSNIHIIGDSQGTGQPKAGHIANTEAKVCADAVIRLLSGNQPYQLLMTNLACCSLISSNKYPRKINITISSLFSDFLRYCFGHIAYYAPVATP